MHTQTPHTQMPARFRSAILRNIAAAVALAALVMLAAALYVPAPAQAQTLPYKAWGAGRAAGDVIVALKGGAEVGRVVVTAAGTWEVNILGGGAANVANGDTIGFTVNGRAANETVTYAAGQFAMPPGLVLTVPAAAPAPAPTPTPAPPATVERGKIAGTPVFDSTGSALAIYAGGTVDELAAEGARHKSTGIWVQDASGTYHLYVIGGPAFIGDQFRAKFPGGFASVTSVLLVK